MKYKNVSAATMTGDIAPEDLNFLLVGGLLFYTTHLVVGFILYNLIF